MQEKGEHYLLQKLLIEMVKSKTFNTSINKFHHLIFPLILALRLVYRSSIKTMDCEMVYWALVPFSSIQTERHFPLLVQLSNFLLEADKLHIAH